jgi:hypothetical protein
LLGEEVNAKSLIGRRENLEKKAKDMENLLLLRQGCLYYRPEECTEKELSRYSVLSPIIWWLINIHGLYSRESVGMEELVEMGTRNVMPEVSVSNLK